MAALCVPWRAPMHTYLGDDIRRRRMGSMDPRRRVFVYTRQRDLTSVHCAERRRPRVTVGLPGVASRGPTSPLVAQPALTSESSPSILSVIVTRSWEQGRQVTGSNPPRRTKRRWRRYYPNCLFFNFWLPGLSLTRGIHIDRVLAPGPPGWGARRENGSSNSLREDQAITRKSKHQFKIKPVFGEKNNVLIKCYINPWKGFYL